MAGKIAFVLTASVHGPLIVNRFDRATAPDGQVYGVGAQILETGMFDPEEVTRAIGFLHQRREVYGDGVVAVDCGANIGVHTVGWARAMTGWGRVIAFEPQERIYYALCGNIALANCFNAEARLAAVGEFGGSIRVPQPDYLKEGSFGSLELRHAPDAEFIGQSISYVDDDMKRVPRIAIDELDLARLDFLKIDVERMEMDVLQGAQRTIKRARPIVMVEWIKTGAAAIDDFLRPLGYLTERAGLNIIGYPQQE